MVEIKLTRRQVEKLYDVLVFAQDEGPSPEGWVSDELEELRDIVGVFINRD